MKYINNVFLLIVFSVFFKIYAQDKSFIYEMRYKPNPNKDSIITDETILDITKEVSVFRTTHDKASDSLKAKTGFGLGRKTRFENQFYIIKKLSSNTIQKVLQNIYSDIYLVNNNEKLDWKIFPEKSKLDKFDVQKAEVSYGGRKWTAWFTSDIPIQDGPYAFYGLPGLIVKIEDEEKNFYFSLTGIQNSTGIIDYRSKGTAVDWPDFIKIASNYYSDPFAPAKSFGAPIRVDDGQGNAVKPDMRKLTLKMQRDIRINNNPIELDKIIPYK